MQEVEPPKPALAVKPGQLFCSGAAPDVATGAGELVALCYGGSCTDRSMFVIRLPPLADEIWGLLLQLHREILQRFDNQDEILGRVLTRPSVAECEEICADRKSLGKPNLSGFLQQQPIILCRV